MFFRLIRVLFRLNGVLHVFSQNYNKVLTASHLVYIIGTGTCIPGCQAHKNSQYSGNSGVFSHINKDLIHVLLTEFLKNKF